jgi:hypothetical protein
MDRIAQDHIKWFALVLTMLKLKRVLLLLVIGVVDKDKGVK